MIEDSFYPAYIEIPVKTKWIETDTETFLTVPTIDAIIGDKLTAFAPNTIGIPYFKGKDKQSFSMEICKQLFDLSKLFEHIEDINVVAKSYMTLAKHEINYRKNNKSEYKLTLEMVLQDTIDTCLIISKRGGEYNDDNLKFTELQRGIKALDRFLISGHFRIDDAIAAARIAYLSAKILVNDLTPIVFYKGQDIRDLDIENQNWNFLNKLKKQPDKSSFYYWYQTVQLLSKKENEK